MLPSHAGNAASRRLATDWEHSIYTFCVKNQPRRLASAAPERTNIARTLHSADVQLADDALGLTAVRQLRPRQPRHLQLQAQRVAVRRATRGAWRWLRRTWSTT